MIDFEQKASGKPRTVRLYNLRKFFRNHAHQAGIEYVNFWMGHKTNYKAPHIPASDVHHFSRENVEFQRQLYAEKAMPHLRLETSTPTETDKIISKQQKEIRELRNQIETLQGNLKQRDNKITELKETMPAILTWAVTRLKRSPKLRKELEKRGYDINRLEKREKEYRKEWLQKYKKEMDEHYAQRNGKNPSEVPPTKS